MQQGGGSQSYLLGGGGGGDGDQSQPQTQQYQMVVEEASPISSRPPATASLDEFGQRPENFTDMDDPDRGGGSGGGGGGNRWPRQETLALLKIRADMDATFRDATVKGPLWEDVSRKMGELGFKRNAKKCKEKFENVDKYYKRTKEGRAGRQDGKTYKFFTELEALHTSSSSAAPPPPPFAPSSNNLIGFSSPTPISSVRPLPPSVSPAPTIQPHVFPVTVAPPPPAAAATVLEFSSNGSSSSAETEDDDDNDEGTDLEAPESSRKRKREGGGGGVSKKMMEFFEGLVQQVMQKQESMQQRFLEAIEKREQDRLIREEAWRRQEMARLAREHEIMAQERAISASRDASILSFLQKVTGQTIPLPPPPVSAAPAPFPPPTTPIPLAVPPQPQPPYPRPQPPPPPPSTVLAVVPEQQVRVHDGEGPSPSRWPKVEVLALIRLRSELETRYQEAGPKGPLWEEISAGMNRLGYKRNPKRCKEKWENINKYFKKVKESNKKRPEDAKTCPYFHELDALYRKKIIGGSGGGGGGGGGSSGSVGGEGGGSIGTQMQSTVDAPTTVVAGTGSAAGDQGTNGGEKKPEDTVKQQQLGLNITHRQNPTLNFSSHGVRPNNGGGGLEGENEDDAMDEDEEYDDEDEDEDEEEDEEMEEERKMGYKIEFQQRQNNKAGPANGGGNGASSAATFLAMVQ